MPANDTAPPAAKQPDEIYLTIRGEPSEPRPGNRSPDFTEPVRTRGIQEALQYTGHFEGRVTDTITSKPNNPTIAGLQKFSREFQKLADLNGYDTGAPGYGDKVAEAMRAGRPEGKINLPPGITQQRAEALYKSGQKIQAIIDEPVMQPDLDHKAGTAEQMSFMNFQKVLKDAGFYQGPIDGRATNPDGTPTRSLDSFQAFSEEYRLLVNRNGQDIKVPGYSDALGEAMRQGRPEGKLNLPPGITEKRANELYKAGQALAELSDETFGEPEGKYTQTAEEKADVIDFQNTLKQTGHYKGPVDGIASKANGTPSATMIGLNNFGEEFRQLANRNGHNINTPGYSDAVGDAMRAGRPEGKINLPPGMTQQRAEALYKAGQSLQSKIDGPPAPPMTPEERAALEKDNRETANNIGIAMRGSTFAFEHFKNDRDGSKAKEFENNYSVNPRPGVQQVGEVRRLADRQREQAEVDQLAKENPGLLKPGERFDIPTVYKSEDMIHHDHVATIAARIGESQYSSYFDKNGELSKDEGWAISYSELSPQQTRALYERAISPGGFGTVSYDRNNPLAGVSESTSNIGGQWAMRNDGVLAEAGGPYAVATFENEAQRQRAIDSLNSANISTISGKNGEKPTLFITGEELDKITPQQLGTVKAFSDTIPADQAAGPAPLESRTLANANTGSAPSTPTR